MVAITLFKVKITDFGTNCKPICDLLLVNNTNLILPRTVSKLLHIKGQISAFLQGCTSL